MNLLWITNILLPPASIAFNMPKQAIGGWMYSSLKRVKDSLDGNIAVATVYPGKQMLEKEVDGIRYFLLPLKGKSMIVYNSHLEELWRKIADAVRPDIVHIHGSEYPHGLAYVNGCGPRGVVVSIQGIISRYARYYAAGIDFTNVKKYLTPRDIIRRDTICNGQKSFENRGLREIELLQKVSNIIGRTDWDRAHVWSINPNAHYHFCGETLRDSFYHNKWSYADCEPHTIFVSQASYPIKGLHKLLEAMPLILSEYPDAKIYAGGSDSTGMPWWRITGYGKYLKRLIKDLNLEGKVIFTGMIDEEQMCQQYLKCNVFVCCSSIENSPNSLGEAQLLRMPHLATFVGGIPEIVGMNHEVLYRFEEHEMLAHKICDIFARKDTVNIPGFDASRYDGNKNTKKLIEIYATIANKYNV